MAEMPVSIECYRLRDLAELLLVFDPEELIGAATEVRIEDRGALYVLDPDEARHFMKHAVCDVRLTYEALQPTAA